MTRLEGTGWDYFGIMEIKMETGKMGTTLVILLGVPTLPCFKSGRTEIDRPLT